MPYDLISILPKIVKDRNLHARWLNTFSYLEYIGFRKIVKSQMSEALTLETLAHATEEGRHALLLKKLAVKTGGAAYDGYSRAALLCGEEAENYFQTLDRACAESIQAGVDHSLKARLVYLCVTWLVEERALSVYGAYKAVLDAAGQNLPLNGLLSEEERHLESVKNSLLQADPNFNVCALKAVEERLFQNYISALATELAYSEQTVEAAL